MSELAPNEIQGNLGNEVSAEENKPVAQKLSPTVKAAVVIVIILVLVLGLIYLANGRLQKSGNQVLAPTQTQVTEVPYGDEDLENDSNWRKAMEFNSETGLFTSYFGYLLKLEPGWRKLDNLSFSEGGVKREVFSPLMTQEIEKIAKEDPYNPNYYLEVEIKDNPENISLLDWVSNSTYTPQGANQRVTNLKVGPYSAVKVTGNQGKGYVDYYISSGGKIYNLGYFYNSTDSQWKSSPKLSVSLFEKIISSFTVSEN